MLSRQASRLVRKAPFRGLQTASKSLNTSQTINEEKETHFGFQTVRESEKAEKGLFFSI